MLYHVVTGPHFFHAEIPSKFVNLYMQQHGRKCEFGAFDLACKVFSTTL